MLFMELATGMAGEVDRAKRVSKSLVFPDVDARCHGLAIWSELCCAYSYTWVPEGDLKMGFSQ